MKMVAWFNLFVSCKMFACRNFRDDGYIELLGFTIFVITVLIELFWKLNNTCNLGNNNRRNLIWLFKLYDVRVQLSIFMTMICKF